MSRKKAAPVEPETKWPGVYLDSMPRMLGFGRGPKTGIRPAGPHKSNSPTRQEIKEDLKAGVDE